MSNFRDQLIHIARRKGYLDAEQAEAARRAVAEAAAQGQPVRLHQLLVDRRLLTREQLLDVRRTMAQEGAPPRLEDYDILARLGRGAMGAIYQARQRSLDRLVAVKVLAGHRALDESAVRRFLREARLGARINHPNIVQVLDVGQWHGLHYIVLEYVPGCSLERLIFRHGCVSEGRVLSIGVQMARALQQAEACGVVHRDIKPANILLTTQGTAKLADLGLAVAAGEEMEEGAGTPLYMSPEQLRNAPELDVRSDIYSLGCTLFHAATGRPPFEGATAVETARLHCERPSPDARIARPGLSPEFCEALHRMMAKRPEDRFANATELLGTLERLQARRQTRRRRHGGDLLWALAFGIGGVVLLMLVLTLLAMMLKGRQPVP